MINEVSIERRIYCLDRMNNNYFKKGAHIAVQRLESAGITLPPPDYGIEEGMSGTRESGNDPFMITKDCTSAGTSHATPGASANSTSTIRMPSHENVTTRSLAPMAKSSSTTLRPGNENTSRGKDIAPAASLPQLRISEDSSSHNSHVSKSKPSMESHAPRRDTSTPSNDPSAFSYGSPRTPAGRQRPAPLTLKTGSGRRAKDENTPLTLSHLGDD
ncbi:MAG: hypothetical protein Q9215_007288, partial [Flavoplaca cf. flavocitrina]